MAMMMQEPSRHLIPCSPTHSSGLLSPPAQPICWRLGTCLGLPRWELVPPRPGGGERRVRLGRNYRTPYRECLTLEETQRRLRRHRDVEILSTTCFSTRVFTYYKHYLTYLHGNPNSYNLPHFKEKKTLRLKGHYLSKVIQLTEPLSL